VPATRKTGLLRALSSLAATLIFVNVTPFLRAGEIAMQFRMDGTLSFWVYCSYQNHQHKKARRTRAEMIVEILRDYERTGDAMRYVNAKGQIPG
jgi:hypothetical protein